MNFSKLFSNGEYIASLCLLTLCLVLLPSIMRQIVTGRVKHYLKVFPIYILMISVQLALSMYSECGSTKVKYSRDSLSNISAFFFVTLESLVFSFYFYSIIHHRATRQCLILFMVIISVLSPLLWYSNLRYIDIISTLTVLEASVLIPVSMYSVYRLALKPGSFSLQSEVEFWVSIAILELLMMLAPIYCLLELFRYQPGVQILDHLAYMVCVVLLTKSFNTKPTLIWPRL